MQKNIDVIGVPFALGGSKSGSARGPAMLIENGLAAHLSRLGHKATYVDTRVNSEFSRHFSARDLHSKKVASLFAVQEVTKLAGAHVFIAHTLGHLPLVIGGDHSISLGTLSQYLDPVFSVGRRVGLLWLDAHYDAHTPTSSHSHYANGLPFASALGFGERSLASFRSTSNKKTMRRLKFAPYNVLHIGAGESDCESEEVALLDNLKVKRVTMADIRRDGFASCAGVLGTFLKEVDDIIFTFDLDAMRQDFVPGVSFQSQSGLLPWHAFMIADAVAHSGKLRQLEIMEYNPDFEESTPDGCPKTADFVLLFLERLFGVYK